MHLGYWNLLNFGKDTDGGYRDVEFKKETILALRLRSQVVP